MTAQTVRVHKLGHAVLKVRSLKTSVPFYRDVLGLNEVARHGSQMVFFSCGENHHDLALLEVGGQASAPASGQVGLYHLAFKVGGSLDELRAFRDHLTTHGVALAGQSDHRVSQSLYCHDPDGIMIELYVDADPAVWRDDPGAVAHIGALAL
ncbi:MAG TPA: VOC family protein [Thiobacillus sp.]